MTAVAERLGAGLLALCGAGAMCVATAGTRTQTPSLGGRPAERGRAPAATTAKPALPLLRRAAAHWWERAPAPAGTNGVSSPETAAAPRSQPPAVGPCRAAAPESVRSRRTRILALAARPDGPAHLAALLDRPEDACTAAACTACWMASRDGIEDGPVRRRLARRLAELATAGVEPETRRAATLALGRVDHAALRRLPDGDPEIAANVANALPPLCAQAAPAMVAHAERLARYGAGDDARVTAVRALVCAGAAGSDRLAALARGSEFDAAAAQARLELARRAATADGGAPAPTTSPLPSRPRG